MTKQILSQTLHTLNKTASAIGLNQQLTQSMSQEDAVLLIEDGVFQCITSLLGSFIHKASAGFDIQSEHWAAKAKTVYVLLPDAKARGISPESINHDKIVFIDYPEFVHLTLKYRKVVSWY
jgi:sulfur relay protein TusB/DsrH